MTACAPEAGVVVALLEGRHGDAFGVLGRQRSGGRALLRTLQPGANAVEALWPDGSVQPLQRIADAGLFAATLSEPQPSTAARIAAAPPRTIQELGHWGRRKRASMEIALVEEVTRRGSGSR